MRLAHSREGAGNLFPDALSLLDQLQGERFRAAHGRSMCVLDPIPPADPTDVGSLVWDVLVASKFAPNAVRMAYRGEIIHTTGRTVRGKTFIDPLQVVTGLRLRQTLNMMGIERFRTDVRAITTGLEAEFEVPCPANLYVSYDGSRGGYGPHRDQHDVIVVHLYGTKVWKIYPPPSDFVPIRKDDPTREQLSGAPHVITMTPGSCVYIPAGFVHDVTSAEGCCVHVTFGVQCMRWLDVLTDLISEANIDELFERVPRDEGMRAQLFEERIEPAVYRLLSRGAISRMMERYRYFGALAKQSEAVIGAIAEPSDTRDR
jgi:ribosomal protein L16 Arg81 hydroxylase